MEHPCLFVCCKYYIPNFGDKISLRRGNVKPNFSKGSKRNFSPLNEGQDGNLNPIRKKKKEEERERERNKEDLIRE